MNIDIHCTHISPMVTHANCCSPHLAVSLGGDHGDSIIVIISWTPSSPWVGTLATDYVQGY